MCACGRHEFPYTTHARCYLPGDVAAAACSPIGQHHTYAPKYETCVILFMLCVCVCDFNTLERPPLHLSLGGGMLVTHGQTTGRNDRRCGDEKYHFGSDCLYKSLPFLFERSHSVGKSD